MINSIFEAILQVWLLAIRWLMGLFFSLKLIHRLAQIWIVFSIWFCSVKKLLSKCLLSYSLNLNTCTLQALWCCWAKLGLTSLLVLSGDDDEWSAKATCLPTQPSCSPITFSFFLNRFSLKCQADRSMATMPLSCWHCWSTIESMRWGQSARHQDINVYTCHWPSTPHRPKGGGI